MEVSSEQPVRQLVDHLFRHRAGQMVATLTRIFGPGHICLAEDVVQEALLKALSQWPFQGIPENPDGWLIQVAKNRALDILRRNTTFRNLEPALQRAFVDQIEAFPVPEEISDDQLRMIFTCCHEAVPREAQVALTLKTLGGFGVAEIARAFLVREATISQRLVRAKRRIRERQIPFELPVLRDLPRRLDSVLEVLYLMFNEGYAAHQGEELLRRDMSREAMRLASLLLEQPAMRLPRVHALLALMFFQAARFPTRLDAEGNLLLLAEQDRSGWDGRLISRGCDYLRDAAAGDEVTVYHIQAGIAACHALAPSYAATDWPRILRLYDLLQRLTPSPVVALNRAVAIAMVDGAAAGMRALDSLQNDPMLEYYYLLPATRGELFRQMDDLPQAAECFRHAAALPCSEPEKRLLMSKLHACART